MPHNSQFFHLPYLSYERFGFSYIFLFVHSVFFCRFLPSSLPFVSLLLTKIARVRSKRCSILSFAFLKTCRRHTDIPLNDRAIYFSIIIIFFGVCSVASSPYAFATWIGSLHQKFEPHEAAAVETSHFECTIKKSFPDGKNGLCV